MKGYFAGFSSILFAVSYIEFAESTILHPSRKYKLNWQSNTRELLKRLILKEILNDKSSTTFQKDHLHEQKLKSLTNINSLPEESNHDLAKRDTKVPVTVKLIHEANECLFGHNKIRKLYRCPNVLWDKDLAYDAEKWALTLALNNNGAQHSSFVDEKGNRYGENLYIYQGSDPKNCHDAIYLWYQ